MLSLPNAYYLSLGADRSRFTICFAQIWQILVEKSVELEFEMFVFRTLSKVTFFLVSGGKTSSGAPVSFLFLSKQLIDHSSLSTDSVVQVQNRIYALSKPGVSFCVRLFFCPLPVPEPLRSLSLFSTSRCTHTLFRSIYALTCASETIGREFYQESHHRVTVGTNNYSVGGKV